MIEEQPRSPALMNGGQSVSPRVPDPRSQVGVWCALLEAGLRSELFSGQPSGFAGRSSGPH
ncbi:hypothetical protein ACFVYV_51610 [Streptomyces mirabilis]|uniref:hypothetical protein n=1 Tax=Streptomyces mirabilis TaxID=68239 RepID=UPI0011C47096